MKVLIACECSGRVREAFRRRGHDAWSCDLQPADDGSQFHIVGDALEVAYRPGWNLVIGHPPALSCATLVFAGSPSGQNATSK